jgi:pyridoxamine 5'-phosphate oxidase
MINLVDMDLQQKPLREFSRFYEKALLSNQQSIEASCVSTKKKKKKSAHSRFVNIKYVNNQDFIFFSNYESNKANEIKTSSKVSMAFYWNTINVQIRIEGNINKIDEIVSDKHFNIRGDEKNALAISSRQSRKIDSYELVKKNYKIQLDKANKTFKRPIYWGGYSISPYYFEFWEGHKSRLNKRDVYEKNLDNWNHFLLHP